MKNTLLQYYLFVLAVTLIACANTMHTSHDSDKRLLKIPHEIIAKQRLIQAYNTQKTIVKIFTIPMIFGAVSNVFALHIYAYEISTRAVSAKTLKLQGAALVFITCANAAVFSKLNKKKKNFTECIRQTEQEIEVLNAELTSLIKPTK